MLERLTFTHTSAQVAAARQAVSSQDDALPLQPHGERPHPRREPRDWAFTGLIAFTALLFFRPQDMLPALAPLHLAELAALGALAALIFGRLSRGLPITRTPTELFGVAALGAVIIFTAPFSIWPGGVLGTFSDLYIKVLLIFLLMANTLTSGGTQAASDRR
jgi:hypothetical protein